MSLILQLVVNGLIAGSIYALVASGFTLISMTNRFMHFAHGGIVVFAGYLVYTFFHVVGFHFVFSVLLAVFYASFLGFFMYVFIYYPFEKRKASRVILLIVSLSLLVLFQNIMLLIYGASVKDVGYIEIKEGVSFLGVQATPFQLTLFFSSLILFVLLFLFMQKTSFGREMRAVSHNKELASLVGIHSTRVSGLSFFIGSFLAGVAGIFIALEQNITPYGGTQLIIKGFSGAIIGGIGSVPASVFGSYLLGLAENIGILFLPSGYKDAISFVLLFLFLLFKPEGIVRIKRRIS